MTNRLEDLEPGDFVLYNGVPAFVGFYETSVVIDGFVRKADPELVEVPDGILTQKELNELPAGSVVSTRDGQTWTKKKVGVGYVWRDDALSMRASAADVAALGASIFAPAAGMTFEVLSAVRHRGGRYTLTVRLTSGSIAGAEGVVSLDAGVILDDWMKKSLQDSVELTEPKEPDTLHVV